MQKILLLAVFGLLAVSAQDLNTDDDATLAAKEEAVSKPKRTNAKCGGASCADKQVVSCDVTAGTGDCIKDALPETDLKCKRHKSCGKCVSDLHCGWCLTTGKCIEGVVTGPKVGNCTDWDYAFCSSEPCSTYGSCGSCAQDPMCGWCGGKGNGTCTEGGKKGPVMQGCPAGKWTYEQCKKADGTVIEKKVVNKNDKVEVAQKAQEQALEAAQPKEE